MTTPPPRADLFDLPELQNLLAGSALSSDVSAEAFQRGIYATDAVLGRLAPGSEYRGRDDIAGIMHDPDHLALVDSGVIHFAGTPFIRIDGDRASACGYLQVLRPDADATNDDDAPLAARRPATWMVTANVWSFERREGTWQIVDRTLRDALTPEGRALIRSVVEPE